MEPVGLVTQFGIPRQPSLPPCVRPALPPWPVPDPHPTPHRSDPHRSVEVLAPGRIIAIAARPISRIPPSPFRPLSALPVEVDIHDAAYNGDLERVRLVLEHCPHRVDERNEVSLLPARAPCVLLRGPVCGADELDPPP